MSVIYNSSTTPQILYTGVSVGGGVSNTVAAGTTRWNSTTNMMEMYDGYRWVAVSTGDIQAVTLADMVQNAEDQLATQIEQEYSNNVTIQDAFKAWEEANERFKVILKLAETK